MVAWDNEMFTTGSVPFEAGSHVVKWEIEIFDRKFLLYAGSYFLSQKFKFLSQEVVPLMRVAIWSNHKLQSFPQQVFTLMQKAMCSRWILKFLAQEVFPLMREAMWPYQNLKFFSQEVFYLMQEAMCTCVCVCGCGCVCMCVVCVVWVWVGCKCTHGSYIAYYVCIKYN